MKRFVTLADLHAHPWSAFSKGDGLRNSRLLRTLTVLEDSLQYAQEHDLPWLFAGDLIHTAGYGLNVVLAGVTEILVRYETVRKAVVWGNHDARGIGGRITVEQTILASLVRMGITMLDPSIVPKVEFAGLTIAGAGYQPRLDLLEFAPPADVGLYHQTLRGALTPDNFRFEEGLAPEELLSRYRLSIVGHTHHPQQIEAPLGQGILIPGSPEQHNFGDYGDHGWWVVTLPEEGNPQLEFIPGGSPEFRTVETPKDVCADGHFYRVRTVPPGATLPDDVIAIAPTPTTVEHRDTLRGVVDSEHILQIWLKTQPPSNGVNADAYLAAGRNLLNAQDPIRLRNVRLTGLHLKNFCCFEDQRLSIQEGLWLILGHGRDYPSNGAGKSSLVGEALYWLLFGRTTKGLSADDVIRWGATECEVTAELLEDSTRLTITRHRGPEGHTLTILQEDAEQSILWEATSVNEMTTKLSHYLGVTQEIFRNLAYFSQEKLMLFSAATDGERKNVLADLIGLGAYQDASGA
ncbi:hypothetical protein LCGC14_2413800, partial [marine sediment metagenome]